VTRLRIISSTGGSDAAQPTIFDEVGKEDEIDRIYALTITEILNVAGRIVRWG